MGLGLGEAQSKAGLQTTQLLLSDSNKSAQLKMSGYS